MPDKTLTCRDCGRQFVFSASEQEFYAQKGFLHEPGRCPECRAARKVNRGGAGQPGPRREREMFPAVCARCGKETEVPFQPRTERPIYCSDCFAIVRGAPMGSGRGDYRRGNG